MYLFHSHFQSTWMPKVLQQQSQSIPLHAMRPQIRVDHGHL